MSKTFHILYATLFIVMIVTIVFLGMRVSDLNEKYFSYLSQKNDTSLEETTFNSKIKKLEESFSEQQSTLVNLKSKISSLSIDDTAQKSDKYMPAPEYSLNQNLFTLTDNNGKQLKITGYSKGIDNWQNRNELFFDYLIKKILTFEYDRRHHAILIQEVEHNSVFYQMGLREGDRILNVNGKRYTKGMELRHKLVDTTNKKISLLRDKKYLTLDLSYNNTLPSAAEEIETTNEQLEESIDDTTTNTPQTSLLAD